MKASVERALPFNCPTCDVGIGVLCVSVQGKPMAEYVHPEREAPDILAQSEFASMQMGEWIWAYGHILLGDE